MYVDIKCWQSHLWKTIMAYRKGSVDITQIRWILDLAHYGEDPLCCSEEPSLGASYTLWYTMDIFILDN